MSREYPTERHLRELSGHGDVAEQVARPGWGKQHADPDAVAARVIAREKKLALESLMRRSGQDFGEDVVKWREWFQIHMPDELEVEFDEHGKLIRRE